MALPATPAAGPILFSCDRRETESQRGQQPSCDLSQCSSQAPPSKATFPSVVSPWPGSWGLQRSATQSGRDVTEAATEAGAVACFPQGLGVGRPSRQRARLCVWPVCPPLQDAVAPSGPVCWPRPSPALCEPLRLAQPLTRQAQAALTSKGLAGRQLRAVAIERVSAPGRGLQDGFCPRMLPTARVRVWAGRSPRGWAGRHPPLLLRRRAQAGFPIRGLVLGGT